LLQNPTVWSNDYITRHVVFWRDSWKGKRLPFRIVHWEPLMVVQKTDLPTLIAKAVELYRRQGYHQTTMADVATACGVLKGSLYHYFPSKEALGLAVMSHVRARFEHTVFRWADDPSLPHEIRLRKMMDETEAYFLKGEGGCVMGNLALEAIEVPGFAPEIRAYFDEWASAFARIFASKMPDAQARHQAQRAVAEIQGAIMMMRACGKSEPFLLAMRAIVDDFSCRVATDA
jgi:TetR/AcrR family transcriptional regulator, lmrAB and yxaGH operons repressor